MIRDIEKWQAWEEEYVGSTPPNHAQNLKIAEALLEEARRLGVFPPKDPLEGIEHKIEFARALNVRFDPPAPR
jgi:hypothetical protein